MRLKMRRWLRLPTPVDLGWSNSNALGMREFTPYQEGKTWEDWDAHCKAHYPVRYFLSEVLPLWIQMWFIWPLGRLRDWVLDHVVPRRRYHFLDLRGIDPISEYSHGYLDPCTVFYLAGWASLMRWHREDRNDPRQWMTAEMLADPIHKDQIEHHDEAMHLVHYWTVTRKEREDRDHALYLIVKGIDTIPENKEAYEEANHAWLEHHRESERLDEEMWLRLAAIRQFLWS